MGDINIDIKDGHISNSTWKHTIELHDLSQIIREPTRITAHSETLIDHIYTSKPENAVDVSVPCIVITIRSVLLAQRLKSS